MKELDLSIVIVNHNAEEFLEQSLKSIYENTQEINFEIIVVDNNSADESTKMVKEKFPQVKLIEKVNNEGFTKAANQGTKESRARFILYLNNDTVVLSRALEEMVKFMDNYPQAGACGAKILNSDGTLQFSCRQFPTYLSALFNRSSLLTRLFPNNIFSKRYLMSDWSHDEVRQVDWVSGSCLIIRRQAMDEVGLMDDGYFIYCEDVDWCYRASQAGWKIYYVHQSQIIHLSGWPLNPLRMVFEHHRSMYRFYRKHYSRSRFIDCIVLTGIVIRLGTILAYKSLGQLLPKSSTAKQDFKGVKKAV